MPLAPGVRLGAYEIVALIGAGGMGEVYRARDTKLNRPVAIKFLSDEIADAAARRRFQREAQMASSLNHPHILTVLDVGELDGRQYLVTEFVDGGTLKDWAFAAKRTWRQIVELLVGVADGLAAAHAAGMVHRDIKPANILVATNGYGKLADFGLAKLLEPDDSQAVTRTLTEGRTRPGIVIGTVPYMSTEQASGQPVDARSDIFSLGVVLYEVLSGRRPFEGATELEIIQAVKHAVAPPLGELQPDLPLALRLVVEKALEKDPAERYQSMRDLVVDLRRLTRQAAEAGPLAATRRKRMWKWAAAAGMVVTGAALVTWLADVGGLRTRLAPGAGSPQIRSIAVLPLRNISRDPDQEYFADGMTEALTTGLAQISALNVISRTSVMRYQGTNKTAPEIARELHVDALVEGAAQRSGDRVLITAQLIEGSSDRHLWAKSYERNLRDMLALQNEVAQAIAQEIQVKLTPQEQVRLAGRRPVNPEAQEAYLRGVYWFQKGAHFTLGQILVFAGRNDEAIEQGPKMLEVNAVAAHGVLGLAYEQKGNLDLAIREFQQRLKGIEQDYPFFPDSTAELAHAYAVSGLRREALQLLSELTEMSKRRFVPSWAFAKVYVGLGDQDRAFESLEKGYDERPS